ncbi:MAG: nitroreductase family protein, partial [Eubacterium sp.]
MDTIKDLMTRRSCRKYKKDQVDPVVLDAILKAGTYAPTARGLQSPIMVVVQDADTIAQLTRMNAEFFGA